MKKFKYAISLLVALFFICEINSFALGEKRKKVVEYMYSMANVEWTTESDIIYWNQRYGVIFKKDGNYKGIPYIQIQRRTSYENFMAQIQKNTDVGPKEFNQYMGSDCSSAIAFAWKQLNEQIPIMTTYDMIPTKDNLYVIKVGNYEVVSEDISDKITSYNGKDVMFSAYSQLHPGDAIVTSNKSTSIGHVRLVTDVDPINQKINFIDQAGVNNDRSFLGNNSTWRVNQEISYTDVFKKGYIPISINALKDKEKIPE